MHWSHRQPLAKMRACLDAMDKAATAYRAVKPAQAPRILGSDRLVDGLVAWGSLDAVATRVKEHLAAGADQVCVQVFDTDPHGLPLRQWREIASVTAAK